MKRIKKIMHWLLNLLWGIQFKKVDFEGVKGYHCGKCHAGVDPYCELFYCPIEDEPMKVLRFRFKSKLYQKILIKWKIAI